jgi:hypothetical protein
MYFVWEPLDGLSKLRIAAAPISKYIGDARPMQNVPKFLRTVGREQYGAKCSDPSGRSRGAPAR